MDPAQIENLKKVANRFPWGALTFRYAIALGLNGDIEGASHMMKTIHGMYGDSFYKGVRGDLRTLAQTYPQLNAVRAP